MRKVFLNQKLFHEDFAKIRFGYLPIFKNTNLFVKKIKQTKL
ncbi:hypothetical protein Cabys_2151 [Caldithrix abyssi DSM 13497]|uniref:Uncharacterized protein n=1 Tax=Caldithrix abyssi DSM 13497 TaxID=880073 RepID=A0A1J1C925_CALAY|nr:hypothetical protein Cabys_2151 [Caldithrix abyssi DSM 13497]